METAVDNNINQAIADAGFNKNVINELYTRGKAEDQAARDKILNSENNADAISPKSSE